MFNKLKEHMLINNCVINQLYSIWKKSQFVYTAHMVVRAVEVGEAATTTAATITLAKLVVIAVEVVAVVVVLVVVAEVIVVVVVVVRVFVVSPASLFHCSDSRMNYSFRLFIIPLQAEWQEVFIRNCQQSCILFWQMIMRNAIIDGKRRGKFV